jgi:hypothetical protein
MAVDVRRRHVRGRHAQCQCLGLPHALLAQIARLLPRRSLADAQPRRQRRRPITRWCASSTRCCSACCRSCSPFAAAVGATSSTCKRRCHHLLLWQPVFRRRARRWPAKLGGMRSAAGNPAVLPQAALAGAVFANGLPPDCAALERLSFVALASGAAFAVATIVGILSFISLYVYEHPHHHCPFCLLKPEYGYQGYAALCAAFRRRRPPASAPASVQGLCRRRQLCRCVVPRVSRRPSRRTRRRLACSRCRRRRWRRYRGAQVQPVLLA